MNDETLAKHMQDDAKFQERMERVLFGDKSTEEMGMKEKVDAMYEILVQAKGVGGFLKETKGYLQLIIFFSAVMVILKGWVKF